MRTDKKGVMPMKKIVLISLTFFSPSLHGCFNLSILKELITTILFSEPEDDLANEPASTQSSYSSLEKNILQDRAEIYRSWRNGEIDERCAQKELLTLFTESIWDIPEEKARHLFPEIKITNLDQIITVHMKKED